jgi:hypothetical protein
MPSAEHPLTGRCACGTVRFRVTEPFDSAGFCHCHRCRRRSGVPFTLNGLVVPSGFEVTAGAAEVTTWVPEGGGRPKSFCRRCGGHVFGGDPDGEVSIAVRLGCVEGDPGIEPSWHTWLSSAPAWYEVPDDGLEHFAEGRR